MAQKAGPELARIGQEKGSEGGGVPVSLNATTSKKSACVPAHARTRIRARGGAARRGPPVLRQRPEASR